MPTVRIVKCSSCRAPVVWMRTTNGKNIPVDPDDIDEATLAWDGSNPIFEPDSHIAHFATCPHAAQHRRPR